MILDLRKRLGAAQFDASMTKDKVQAIVRQHRINTLKMVNESLAKGWKLWAAQAVELHTYKADRENRCKDGKGFYKPSEDSIATIRENLTHDYRALGDRDIEEITLLLEDFGENQEETLRQLHDIGSELLRYKPNIVCVNQCIDWVRKTVRITWPHRCVN